MIKFTKSSSSFRPPSTEEAGSYLADHAPSGRVFAKKLDRDTNLGRLIISLADWIKNTERDIWVFAVERDIRKADNLLPEWEDSVRIPEKYARRETVDGRREAIERKFSKIPVYNVQSRGNAPINKTIEDYILKLTGQEIAISFVEAEATFPLSFPVKFDSRTSFLFIIEIEVDDQKNNTFPLSFPVSFLEPAIPSAIKGVLDIVLDDVVPLFCSWTYKAISN